MKWPVLKRAIFLVVGVAVLLYLLRSAGTGSVQLYLRNLGPWIAVPFAFVGLQHALRSLSWYAAVKATGHPVPFLTLLRARLGAECLGYLSLTGALGSQTSKVWLLREGVPMRRGAASVIVDALASAIAGVLYAGVALLVCQYYLNLPTWTSAIGGALVAIAVAGWAMATVWSEQRRHRVEDYNVLLNHPVPPGWRAGVRDSFRRVRAALVRLRGLHIARMILIHSLGHVALTLATWSILALLGISSSFVVGLLFEVGAKLGNVMGAFIPARLGVFEAGVTASSGILHMGAAAGLAVGLVRRLVDLIWVALGLVILTVGGANARSEEERAGKTASTTFSAEGH
jgi:uncharacterized membrane protein YbhN (UPF0104 family)